MNKAKKWTEEEDSILKQLYGGNTYKEMIEILHRSKKSIEGRLSRLGLQGKYEREYHKNKYKTINNKIYKKCKRCGKMLPCNEIYYSRDTSLEEGIRNICKRCKGENYNMAPRYKLTKDMENFIILNYKIKTNEYIANELNKKYNTDYNFDNISKIVESLRRNEKITGYKSKKVKVMAWCYSESARLGQKRNSERLKNSKKWVNEDNPFFGSSRTSDKNPNWAGGRTILYNELRTQITKWKNESMKSCNYKCILTNEKFDHIHHLYPYKNIIDECFYNLKIERKLTVSDYSKHDFLNICNEIRRLHDEYGIGVCLSKKVHKKFHDNYGYFNNTTEQFYDFAKKYYNVDVKEKLNLK